MSEAECVIDQNEDLPKGSLATAVSNPHAGVWITAIGVGGLLVGIVGILFGWILIVKGFLWIVTIGLGAFAILLVFLANDAKSSEKERAEAWIGVAVFTSIGFATWIAIPPGEPIPLNPSTVHPDDPLSPQGRQTFNYWSRLYGVALRSRTKLSNPQQLAPLCNKLASEIDQMATGSVDQDAISCAMGLRTWFVDLAAEHERRGSPEALVSALARGFQGDILGPFLDENASTESFAQRLRAIQNQLVSTRAVLSSRYGTEFARIEP